MNLYDASNWRVEGDRAFGEIPPGWAQGRAAFGGLVVQSALKALRALEPEGRPLRSVLTNFVGPALEGPIEAELRVLRSGRSVTHTQAIVMQEGSVRTVVIACFGGSRPTTLTLPSPAMPSVPGPEGLPPMPLMKGLIPDFLQNFDVRVLEGIPFTGSAIPRVRWWMRPSADTPIEESTLAGLFDLPPPPILPMATAPFPSSSLTWQLDVLEAPKAEDEWWFYEGDTSFAGQGYADLNACLWARDGRMLARGRQLFTEFSGRVSK